MLSYRSEDGKKINPRIIKKIIGKNFIKNPFCLNQKNAPINIKYSNADLDPKNITQKLTTIIRNILGLILALVSFKYRKEKVRTIKLRIFLSIIVIGLVSLKKIEFSGKNSFFINPNIQIESIEIINRLLSTLIFLELEKRRYIAIPDKNNVKYIVLIK